MPLKRLQDFLWSRKRLKYSEKNQFGFFRILTVKFEPRCRGSTIIIKKRADSDKNIRGNIPAGLQDIGIL